MIFVKKLLFECRKRIFLLFLVMIMVTRDQLQISKNEFTIQRNNHSTLKTQLNTAAFQNWEICGLLLTFRIMLMVCSNDHQKNDQ